MSATISGVTLASKAPGLGVDLKRDRLLEERARGRPAEGDEPVVIGAVPHVRLDVRPGAPQDALQRQLDGELAAEDLEGPPVGPLVGEPAEDQEEALFGHEEPFHAAPHGERLAPGRRDPSPLEAAGGGALCLGDGLPGGEGRASLRAWDGDGSPDRLPGRRPSASAPHPSATPPDAISMGLPADPGRRSTGRDPRRMPRPRGTGKGG